MAKIDASAEAALLSGRRPDLHRDTSDEELTSDASLWRLKWPIALSGGLSTMVALTDSVALSGLAVRLASGFSGDEAALFGLQAFTKFPVIITLVIVTFLLNFGNTYLRSRVSASWDAARRMDLIRAYRRADFPTQSSYSGSALSTATEQIGKASVSIGAVIGLINSVILAAVYIGLAFVISWQVSLIVVATGGSMVAGLRQVSKRTRRMHKDMSRRYIHVGEEIGEMAISARELHTLNRWDETEQHLASETSTIQRVKMVSMTMAGMVGPMFWMGTLFVGIAVAASAGDDGATTTGIAASGLLLIRALTATQAAQTMYQTYHDAYPYVDRIRSVIAGLRRAQRAATVDSAPEVDGTVIAVEHANLTYGRDVVVRDLSIELDGPGGIAIVGPSGSGKTTTLLALSGLAEPSSGDISINGVPLTELDSEGLGALIGYLPQDPKLLRSSLRSNLLRPDVQRSDDDLWATLTNVGLDETVGSFRGHLDASVGRAAEGFSGGELQRLGLARLLVNSPTVWLVDEPTSALDRINSDRVLELLATAMEERLVVVVTHRPELLHHCKRVIYMDGGVVVDDGPLELLVSRQPFVASMVSARTNSPDTNGSTEVESTGREPPGS